MSPLPSPKPKGTRGPKRPDQRGQKEREIPKIKIWGWPLPDDVRQALGRGVSEKEPCPLLEKLESPYLLLQRYLAYPKEGEKSEDRSQAALNVFQENLTTWEWGRTGKSDLWQALVKCIGKLYQQPKGAVSEFLQKCQERQDALRTAWEAQGYKIRCLPKKRVVWRLAIGLGLPSPLEVGITLHHLYGFPYLPGSAIKGVTRNWRMQKIANDLGIPRLSAQHIHQWKNEKHYGPTPWELLEKLLMSPVPKDSDSEERKEHLCKEIKNRLEQLQETMRKGLAFLKYNGYLSDGHPKVLNINNPEWLEQNHIRDFSRAFGSTEAKGEIIFLDAYPEALIVDGKPILELDVMNPHYSDYYTGDKPPADWLSPVPVFFLAVRQGTTFQICLAGRDQNLLGEVEKWVKEALQEFGIGAKTRAGYGELQESLATRTKQGEEASTSAAQAAATPAADHIAALQAAIEHWTACEMGNLQQLVESISQVAQEEQRHELAQRLQKKLETVKKWGRSLRSSPWHQMLEKILGEASDEPS